MWSLTLLKVKLSKEAMDRKEALSVLKDLESHGCDPVSIARDASHIQSICLEGIWTQKVSNRVESGVVDVKEIHPDVALRALAVKRQAYQDVLKSEDLSEPSESSFTITVTRAEPDVQS